MTTASSKPPKSGERLRVLLVEDSPQVRRSMARALKVQFTVVEAPDGEAAVHAVRDGQLRGETFDVVVTDLEMPNMNGREALAEISKIAPQLAACSIVLTGGAKDPQLAAWLQSLPAERVIAKPTDGKALRKAICDLVG
jgi:two-component system, chemotaxis family, chemotaxis protein CheY